MAKNYNSEVTKEFRDVSKSQTSRDVSPSEYGDKILPVVDINPKHSRIITITKKQDADVSSTSTTIYTTPTNQDFYLVGFSHGLIKNATCDAATGRQKIAVTIGGASVAIGNIEMLTLTAQNIREVVMLPIPMKIDRNTNITCTSNAFTAGSMIRTGTIFGFLDEQSLA